MAVFQYTALDSHDAFIKGDIEARSEKAAQEALEKDGYLVVNVKREARTSLWYRDVMFSSVSAQDRIFFTRNILTMIEAGISLDQALRTTADQISNQQFRQTMHLVHQQVEQGLPFYRALGMYPKFFGTFFVNMIKVGELSGKLDEVLGFLLEQQEKDYTLKMKAKSAMVYPGIIVCVLIVMVTLMLTFVIPQVSGVLASNGGRLPLPTRVLLNLSWFVIHYGWTLIIAVIAAVYLFRRSLKTPAGKLRWAKFLLRAPILSNIVRQFNLALIMRSLRSLIKSGVALDQALKLASSVTQNALFDQSLNRGVDLVRKGVPLAEVVKGYPRLYPPLTSRMIEVGEKTGKLDHMLGRLASFYEQSVENTLTSASSIIEPVLLVIVGLTVAFVAVSVMLPIWSFSQTIT